MTADLIPVQMMMIIIDTLRVRVIAEKRLAVQRVPSRRILMLKKKKPIIWRASWGWMRLVSVQQEPPYTDIFRRYECNNCCIHIKPVLNESLSQKCLSIKDENNWIAGEVLYSDESQFCISFRNQGPKVWWLERHRIQCVLSLEWIFHSLWWFAMPVICRC